MAGFILGYGNAAWLSFVQLAVPREMQGRYFGVDQLGSLGVIPVGQVAGAFLGRHDHGHSPIAFLAAVE